MSLLDALPHCKDPNNPSGKIPHVKYYFFVIGAEPDITSIHWNVRCILYPYLFALEYR